MKMTIQACYSIKPFTHLDDPNNPVAKYCPPFIVTKVREDDPNTLELMDQNLETLTVCIVDDTHFGTFIERDIFIAAVTNENDMYIDEDGDETNVPNPASTFYMYVTSDAPEMDEELDKKHGFDDIAGMEQLKQQLRDEILFPLRNRDRLKRYRIHPNNGILLYGPPGCGKTYIAERLAEEAGMNFIMKSAGDVSGKYIHETTNGIKKAFEEATVKSPCILCIDEIDALCPKRSAAPETSGETDFNEHVGEFLRRMNNCHERGIIVVGTTNNPTAIDPAILRPGRFDLLVHIPLPDKASRRQMLEYHLADRPQEQAIDLDLLSEMTAGMSASDIESMVNAVALRAAISDEPITYALLSKQAKSQRRSVTMPSPLHSIIKTTNHSPFLPDTTTNKKVPS